MTKIYGDQFTVTGPVSNFSEAVTGSHKVPVEGLMPDCY